MSAATQQSIEHAMALIELEQLRKGAEVMARHILAQPATGPDALSEARRVANDVIAAIEVAK